MELKDFISKSLDQITEGIKVGGGFALHDAIQFDLPLNAPDNIVKVVAGDTAKMDGFPRVTFYVQVPAKPKAK